MSDSSTHSPLFCSLSISNTSSIMSSILSYLFSLLLINVAEVPLLLPYWIYELDYCLLSTLDSCNGADVSNQAINLAQLWERVFGLQAAESWWWLGRMEVQCRIQSVGDWTDLKRKAHSLGLRYRWSIFKFCMFFSSGKEVQVRMIDPG